MVEKKFKKKSQKMKTRKTRQSTSINITIDNRKSAAPRKAREATSKDSKLKPGTQNVPLVNYFPQFQPARSVITEQKPNNGFSSADFERVTSQYQTQFKEYLDGKLDGYENKILEDSLKEDKVKNDKLKDVSPQNVAPQNAAPPQPQYYSILDAVPRATQSTDRTVQTTILDYATQYKPIQTYDDPIPIVTDTIDAQDAPEKFYNGDTFETQGEREYIMSEAERIEKEEKQKAREALIDEAKQLRKQLREIDKEYLIKTKGKDIDYDSKGIKDLEKHVDNLKSRISNAEQKRAEAEREREEVERERVELESLWHTFEKNHKYLKDTYGKGYTARLLTRDKLTIPTLKKKIAEQREFLKVQGDEEPT